MPPDPELRRLSALIAIRRALGGAGTELHAERRLALGERGSATSSAGAYCLMLSQADAITVASGLKPPSHRLDPRGLRSFARRCP